MAEPKVSDYFFQLPELYYVKSIIRHQVNWTVGVIFNKRYVVPLTQRQPPKMVDRAPISVMELNELQVKIEEQERKTNNSKILGTDLARLEEELRQLKLEVQRLHEQILKTKGLLVNAGNQQQACSRQVEMLNTELEDAKIGAKSKIRECVAIVNGREKLTRERENAKEDIKNFRSRLKKELSSRNIKKRLEEKNSRSLV